MFALKPTVASVRKIIVLAFLSAAFVFPLEASSDPMREFVLSCSYGVMAGTLVGAATLAFSDRPGDNLNKVARGASIGMYAGILLGLYVVYGVPSGPEEVDDDDDALEGQVFRPPPILLQPLLGERGLEGAAVQVSVFNF